ncbi:MAG TPA: GNAT family protein [Thermoleophilaceae bacterium]|jgi:aminoglycoside 6'-N-acetyltransferase|nr:GNAT family protein [Thermoleophilaceae bacterium]
MTLVLEPLDIAHVAPLRALHQQPGVSKWWGPMEPDFPFDEAESTRFAVVVDGSVAGLVQYGEEKWPENRHAWIDIFVGDDYAGRGIGTEVVRQVLRMLLEERGHHRITIDPAVENGAAIRCYEKAGFRRVGVLQRAYREAWSGGWRDELLMELVVV